MTAPTVNTIGQALADGLCRDDDACAALCVQLLRLLADGQPVSREHLATPLGVARDVLDATLRRIPNVAFDQRGRIVAAGLSLLPTPHHFEVNGHALYTWCALDTLMYPVVLGQSAHVASRCPISGAWVQLTVTPERVEDLDPVDTQVSVVVPDAAAACCDVRGAFCQHVHFFAGAEAGATWRATHPEAVLLSVEEAFAVARLLARTRYRTASSYYVSDIQS
jgi:alkylmercury lyase